jgi:hypothetical protein
MRLIEIAADIRLNRFGEDFFGGFSMGSESSKSDQKPSVTLPGTVEKIIKSPDPREPEKAQIGIDGAEHLYREIRIDNVLTDEDGEKVALKQGADVQVTVAAEPEATRTA